ncbi:YajG family lipoprotein [Acetobacter orleanensis]|uniref:YajG family lipoprotein n=1 Tax=Acetobacter orleanensis TaxID=104099 RepID=UPI0006625799|nr:YajG family lipoprotein [Acetobacter orleanensis]KXV62306.1 hypothetical protein AD949_11090 [Acetobacter orleanensis]PCD79478.1 hypothetical protein CO710_07525 [Acetobacter orleanensis]
MMLFRSSGLVVLLLSLSACALGSEHIDVAYKPSKQAEILASAALAPVQIAVSTDHLSPNDRVGTKINGYGMEGGSIQTTKPISDIVKSAFETELLARGFPEKAGGKTVTADVTKFYNKFHAGFVGEAVATVEMNVKVTGPNNSVLYEKAVTGAKTRGGLMAMTSGEARKALEGALSDAVSQVVSDPNFINTLSSVVVNKEGINS